MGGGGGGGGLCKKEKYFAMKGVKIGKFVIQKQRVCVCKDWEGGWQCFLPKKREKYFAMKGATVR